MPSLLNKIKHKSSSHGNNLESRVSSEGDALDTFEEHEQPPKFTLHKQSTTDPEPLNMDSLKLDDDSAKSALYVTATSNAHSPSSHLQQANTTSQPNAQQSPSIMHRIGRGPPPSPSSPSTLSPSPNKGLSRFLSITRRASHRSVRSLRSRASSSSTIPDFRPIEQTENAQDMEAQWEHRATMLARSGPIAPVPLVSEPELVSLSEKGMETGQLPPRIPTLLFHPRRAESLGKRRSEEKPQMISDQSEEEENVKIEEEYLQKAINLHEAGQLESATALFRKCATPPLATPMGQLMYGLSLRHGWGCAVDLQLAITFLRSAAALSAQTEELALLQGSNGGGERKGELILAIFELGNCFKHGWGVEIDKKLAKSYFETAANLGDSDAMYEVGWCFETGFGVKKDKYLAAMYYRRSERAGSKVVGMQWIWKDKYNAADESHNPGIPKQD